MLDALKRRSGMIALEGGKNLPPIIYYHRVAPGADPDTGVTPPAFDRQMGILKSLGFRGVSLREALKSDASSSAGMICITFDDGYQDNYAFAAPVLEKYGFRGTIYCVTGKMGEKTAWADDPRWVGHRLMTGSEARELAARGFEIAAHSRTHPDLSSLTGEELWTEVRGSREELEEVLGETVETFCYPYGFYNDETREAASRAGYRAARSTRRMRPGKTENLFDLPARSISGEMSLARFAVTVSGFRLLEGWRSPLPPVFSDGESSS
ncbi:MAG: polysaccharide deacetylase family protein [Nitrospirae bacterium]|nr:MAG: Polysaccharide deacetylase [Leptospirillum sp. Group IV 'UBA BS']MCL4486223.1 polysaccharide deacetylase family protein [Nitrospirota bacterium]MCL5285420.1 polysaccharide deacetylase family protein [Nitrospirota bacterium]